MLVDTTCLQVEASASDVQTQDSLFGDEKEAQPQ